MKTISYAFAIVLSAAPLVAYGQSGISVWGAGGLTCGEWLEATKHEWPREQYTDWILGFLTSFNYYNPSRQVNPPDRASVSAWVDKYCRDNPFEELGDPKASHQWKR